MICTDPSVAAKWSFVEEQPRTFVLILLYW